MSAYFNLQTTGDGPTCQAIRGLLRMMAAPELETLAGFIEQARSNGKKESVARVRLQTLMTAADGKER